MAENETGNYVSDGSYPFYILARTFLRMLWLVLWRWKRVGRERMPREGGVIVASNHASFLDPPILGCFYDRPVGYLARSTLFRGFFGTIIRKLYAFPLEREGDPRSALRTMGTRLDHGECVAMFPEGTRSRDGRLGEMKRGVGMLAVRHNATVLPTYIGGAFESWPRNQKFPKFTPLRIEAGDPIIPRDCRDDRAAAKAEEQRIQAEVEAQLKELESRYFAAIGRLLPAPEMQSAQQDGQDNTMLS